MIRPTKFIVITTVSIATMAATLGVVSGGDSADPTDDQRVWKRLKTLNGSWVGTGSGKPGTSRIEREYELILHDQFLFARNVARFAPRADGVEGEVHMDWAIFSYDTRRGKVVLREFHGEGYVNQYVLEKLGHDGTAMTFTTEAIENGPPGMGARLTMTMTPNGEIRENFELAFPGKEFESCVRTSFKRSP